MNNVDPTTDQIDHTSWCENHVYDTDDGWCSTRDVEVGGCTLNISTGTTDGTAKLFGLYEVDEVVTLDDAERIASALLTLLAQVRSTPAGADPADTRQFLPLEEACRRLGCTRYDLEQLIASNQLEAVACGPVLLVPADDVDQFGGAL